MWFIELLVKLESETADCRSQSQIRISENGLPRGWVFAGESAIVELSFYEASWSMGSLSSTQLLRKKKNAWNFCLSNSAEMELMHQQVHVYC